MEKRAFETPFGPIWLWGQAEAFSSDKPLVFCVAGSFAILHGPLFQLAPLLAPHVDVITGHLPGNHCPSLAQTSVGMYSAAYSHVLNTAFAHRKVMACGASIGALVTLGLRSPTVRAGLAVEPVLTTAKLWPMHPFRKGKLAAAPEGDNLRDFIPNVFGVTPTGIEDRDYRPVLQNITVPTCMLVGDQPLYPERTVQKLPSLVDEPERELLSGLPRVSYAIAPHAGHNVLQESSEVFVAKLRQMTMMAIRS